MIALYSGRRVAGLMFVAAALAVAEGALAEETKSGASQIFQQRTADGRTVLTDRPVAGAVTQRTWEIDPQDAVEARQRRDEARLDALAVDERIRRRIDAERQGDQQMALARMQLAAVEAERDAVRIRAEEAARSFVVVVPSHQLRRIHSLPRKQWPQHPRMPMTSSGGRLISAPPA